MSKEESHSNKINNAEEIKKLTQLGLGKLFYPKKGMEIDYANLYDGDNYIYDTNSCNYHFLPNITDETESLWREYLNQVKKARERIKQKLEENGLTVSGTGKNGSITPLSSYRTGFNQFYRCLVTGSRDTGFFTINFMRWYIDKERNVNCRLGEIQFDYSENGCVNRKNVINYPTSYRGQRLERTEIHEITRSCIYNPMGTGDIWNLDADLVVRSFIAFREHILHRQSMLKDS